MSKVLRCDRCRALEPDKVDANTEFSIMYLRRRSALSAGKDWIDLCPHCVKKLEDFLSDPNCMENIEEETSKDSHVTPWDMDSQAYAR